jgi:hypothetical protein
VIRRAIALCFVKREGTPEVHGKMDLSKRIRFQSVRLVGAVGIEQNTHRILTELHLKLQSVLLLITNDLAQLKDQLPPSAAHQPHNFLRISGMAGLGRGIQTHGPPQQISRNALATGVQVFGYGITWQ